MQAGIAHLNIQDDFVFDMEGRVQYIKLPIKKIGPTFFVYHRFKWMNGGVDLWFPENIKMYEKGEKPGIIEIHD
jgi:hypothetical protein